MKRTPAVALSIFLAPPMAMALTIASFGATPESEPYCIAQPGRLETAREIKTEADAFISKGRDLSQRVRTQIIEAEKLKSEALKLQVSAQRLCDQQFLLVQASAAEIKPAGETAADAKPADAKAADANKVKDETLTGRASTLQTLPQPNIPLIKLRGPQLQQAMKQFNVDVEQFKIHAADYDKHYNMFRNQVGECHAARSSFDQLHKKYEMHCTAYHLNNIPPPHLCPQMTTSVSEASGIANQLMNDQMRALRAEGQLKQEEGRLQELEGMQGTADTLVVKASERNRREKEIAGMFGRLRQEYDLLEIERKTIDHSRGAKTASAPVVRPYVSGKVKKAK